MIYKPMPRFSVIIPVYNRAHLIGRAVNSVLSQTYEDFEIIVVDDGSEDLIDDEMSKITDHRVAFVRQANSGASAARNAGIDRARGKFVAFLDSDDVFLPMHLETLNTLLDGRENIAVYSPVIVDRGGGNTIVKPPRGIKPTEDMATYLICGRGFVQTSGLIVPAELARKVHYRADASFGDDTDFAIRLQLGGCEFHMNLFPTVVWFDGWQEDRLSIGRRPIGELPWLNDLRGQIPERAYHGYRGWHYAKSIYQNKPIAALSLFFKALLMGSYPLSLAPLIFLQICLSDRAYRKIADWRVAQISKKGDADEASRVSEDGGLKGTEAG
ncbi:glycosyltransferase family 2 protein (plasmid) [Rhizobium sp. CB3171]|uniref:glycosyltransferase family 2 protein n=1 Tax=Rhizobium sp. CB3171 TaxID=3039157 RepID=UPI0024B24E61|nr:glycosyltransferase family 2 protein [Rhizobium sp. CB3171]WFU07160.1 glycosyltransferase family 2 protein [Rhizobium sp. CB3171]